MPDYFLDTNTLWWYLVKNSKYHKQVSETMNNLILDTENRFFTNSFVIIELFHHLMKKRGELGYQIARSLLTEDHSFFQILFDTKQLTDLQDILEELHQFAYQTTLGGRDSTIIHSMQTNAISSIITNDAGFDNVDWLTSINPI